MGVSRFFSQTSMRVSTESDAGNCALLGASVFLTCSVVLFPPPLPARCQSCEAAASAPGLSLEMSFSDFEKSDNVPRGRGGSRFSGCCGFLTVGRPFPGLDFNSFPTSLGGNLGNFKGNNFKENNCVQSVRVLWGPVQRRSGKMPRGFLQVARGESFLLSGR